MDPIVEPSLLLAQQHPAQREHEHSHQHNHKSHNHHRSLHKRQAADSGVESVLVVQTVSVVQQISIDSNGITASLIYTPTPEPGSQAPSTDSLNQSSAITLSHNNFSNPTSTTSSHSSSRTSVISISSSTQTTADGSSTISSSSFNSDASVDPTSTGATGLIGGVGSGSATGASSSSTSGAGSSSSHSTAAVSTPIVVGSVVSGLAGLAIIVAIAFFIWRWRKKKSAMLPLGNGDNTTRSVGAPSASDPAPAQMAQRRSFAAVVPAALAKKVGMKRFMESTDNDTISSTAGSEPGFYKVSGRKIESVLSSGGDGYGGLGPSETAPPQPYDRRTANTLSTTSWYSDNDAFPPVDETASPLTRLAMPAGPNNRDSGVPVSRPSPARTPVIEHGPFAEFPLNPMAKRDALGRSRPSQDRSNPSRFREEV
ncbi:hypothetical protein BJ878DRAFT_536120 [Calycina marina]|uniref:Uncharacterized protein n=1 Tax=Calycina marina TaxID=1763456 RepID=A0A9P7YY48_9HELO|nr:hypothetical protein BJ878DRAFT_536120 [Calycina marina]